MECASLRAKLRTARVTIVRGHLLAMVGEPKVCVCSRRGHLGLQIWPCCSEKARDKQEPTMLAWSNNPGRAYDVH